MKGACKMPLLCYSWGTTSQERLLDFPCDSVIEKVDDIYHRGVTVESSPEIIFRWICQLRVGMYVFGRKDSPKLTLKFDALAVGQNVMDFFEIICFEINKHLTIRIKQGSPESKIYGDVAVSYVIISENEHRCRLLVRTCIQYPKIFGMLLRFVLPWGDLIMIRRQLYNFKKLSEQIA
jgi:hypothetical protein